jgi:hypothetical protein
VCACRVMVPLSHHLPPSHASASSSSCEFSCFSLLPLLLFSNCLWRSARGVRDGDVRRENNKKMRTAFFFLLLFREELYRQKEEGESEKSDAVSPYSSSSAAKQKKITCLYVFCLTTWFLFSLLLRVERAKQHTCYAATMTATRMLVLCRLSMYMHVCMRVCVR